ncbi:MAG: ATP-grasp domain-containing protein [Pseudomonadota bacterium]
MKKYEFWHPRVFELPFYIYLGWQCLINGVSIRTLAKANYALDHGEIGLGSKLDSQLAFNQDYFLPSTLVSEDLSDEEKQAFIHQFVEEHGYPVILKSNMGCVGKGIAKVNDAADVEKFTPLLMGDYILQKFTPFNYECGVFYVRMNGKPRITGVNKKHFPTVVGNGRDTILTLAQQHPRYTQHWDSFLQDIDTSEVLAENQEKRLSFIGSHTLGCKFTDDTHLVTPELEKAIFHLFESQPGFNFGRVDVKCENEAAFQRGEFVVIEVNGVASLPTNMFDPKFSVWQAYKIFFEHGKYLVKIAREHRHQPMELLSYLDVMKQAKANAQSLNDVHQRLMGR